MNLNGDGRQDILNSFHESRWRAQDSAHQAVDFSMTAARLGDASLACSAIPATVFYKAFLEDAESSASPRLRSATRRKLLLVSRDAPFGRIQPPPGGFTLPWLQSRLHLRLRHRMAETTSWKAASTWMA